MNKCEKWAAGAISNNCFVFLPFFFFTSRIMIIILIDPVRECRDWWMVNGERRNNNKIQDKNFVLVECNLHPWTFNQASIIHVWKNVNFSSSSFTLLLFHFRFDFTLDTLIVIQACNWNQGQHKMPTSFPMLIYFLL